MNKCKGRLQSSIIAFSQAFLLSTFFWTNVSIAGLDSWTTHDPMGIGVMALSRDPNSPETAYAGLDSGVVLKTTDGGASWFPTGTIPVSKITAFAVDYHPAGYIYAGTQKGIYRSANKGASWVASNRGLSNREITVLLDDPNTVGFIYAGTRGGGVFRSVDAGRNWKPTWGLSGMTINAMATSPFFPETVYAATTAGIYKCLDSGYMWSLSSDGLPATEMNISALVVSPHVPDLLFAASSSHVYSSIDGGVNWVRLKAALPSAITDLAVDPNSVMPNTLYAATALAGVFKSDNQGRTWISFNTGLYGNPKGLQVNRIAVESTVPPILYAATAEGTYEYSYSLVPQAAFRATLPAGATPRLVAFMSLSTGYISSYRWDFGDLTSSRLPSTRHQYDAPGTYTVKLTVKGPGGTSSTTKTIQATEVLPTVTINAPDGGASEKSGNLGRFIVSRTGSTSSGLSVFYGIRGTATNGVDYRTISGVAIIPAGMSSTRIVVNPIEDTLVEGNEVVALGLMPDPSYNLGASTTARVVIRDND